MFRTLSLRSIAVLLAIAAVLTLVVLQRPSTAATTTPPRLAWELPGGIVDVSKLPASLPALDCNGNVVATLKNPFGPTASWQPLDENGQPCARVEVSHDEDYETDVHS